MKRLSVVALLAGLAPFLWSAPTIDGVISPGEGWVLIGTSQYATGGGDGAHLADFYYYPYHHPNDTLYLAFTTNNTASWNVAYGIGLDIDRVPNSGYYTGTDDAWHRKIYFENPPAIEWEFYWWWDGNTGAITSFNACEWTGSGWNYLTVGTYAYSGDGANGLQTLEYKVPFSDLNWIPGPDTVRVILWIAGGDGSSAVDVIPYDSDVSDGGGTEWTDNDDVLGGSQAVEVAENSVPYIGTRISPQINGLRISSDSPVQILLYRTDGRLVLKHKVNGFLDLRNLDRGVYLYRVSGSRETGKVLVIR